MRITQQMVTQTTLSNVQRNLERLEELQNQITSGSRLRRPSDDPIGVARALNFQDGLDLTGQYLKNIDQAAAWLNTSDSALNSVAQVLQRAQELGVQGNNGAIDAEARQNIQAEIQQLQQQALEISNTKFGTRYLFAGTANTNPAYTSAAYNFAAVPPAPATSYQGNTAAVNREVSSGVTLGINIPGSQVFDPVFKALARLNQGLGTNSSPLIGNALDDLNSALDVTIAARAEMGAKANRVEFMKGRLEEVQVSLSDLLSSVKDVDIAQAVTNFSMADTAYKASLQAASKTIQPSLLDYL